MEMYISYVGIFNAPSIYGFVPLESMIDDGIEINYILYIFELPHECHHLGLA